MALINIIKRFYFFIWRRLGSIHLTVALCLLLAADLGLGYICLNRRMSLFEPLNEIGLMPWLYTYGLHNLAYTVWFIILLGLLTLLCINTFVCTTDRVVWLMRSRGHFTARQLFFRFAPHIMHYAVIVILAGYLFSYLFSQVLEVRTLVPGSSMTLPGTRARITFESLDPVYYEGDRLPPAFHNRVLQPRARLFLIEGERGRAALLTCNRPVWFKGYGLFLKDFAPKIKGGMGLPTRIDLVIRKDPGVVLYLAGMILFTLGLAMYLFEWAFLKKIKKEVL